MNRKRKPCVHPATHPATHPRTQLRLKESSRYMSINSCGVTPGAVVTLLYSVLPPGRVRRQAGGGWMGLVGGFRGAGGGHWGLGGLIGTVQWLREQSQRALPGATQLTTTTTPKPLSVLQHRPAHRKSTTHLGSAQSRGRPCQR